MSKRSDRRKRKRQQQLAKQYAKKKQYRPHSEQAPAAPPAAIVGQTNDGKTEAHQPTGTESPPAKHKTPITPRWLCRWRNWQKLFVISELVFAAAIAWFAWVQADVGGGQLATMINQNEIMIRQLEQTDAQLRPYLSAQAPQLITLTPEQHIVCKVPIVNDGNTPGIITRSRIGTIWQPPATSIDRLKQFHRQQPEDNDTVKVPPNKATNLTIVSPDKARTEDFPKLMRGDLILNLIGDFTYRDRTGKEHTEEFAYWFHPGSRRFILRSGEFPSGFAPAVTPEPTQGSPPSLE